jgi:hypothetical protein
MSASKKWVGWHFLKDDRRLRWGTEQKIRKGTLCKVKGRLSLCEYGLHASKKAFDALKYAPGSIVCRVELRGKILEADDKACAEQRKVLAIADATSVLHEFACWCAEGALKRERKAGREPDKRSWDAIKTKRRWLRGNASDDELAAASTAARDAAGAAASAAASTAASTAAWAAASAAASTAAWDAASTAASAAASTAAWDAARDAQNRKLTKMLEGLF